MTPKQELFVAEYLKDLNATQAAIRAGYSRKVADVNGPRLLGNAGIAAKVARLQKERLAKVNVTADDVLREMAFIGMQRASSFFDKNGNVLPVNQLPPEADAALADHEVVQGNLDKGDGQRDRLVKIRKWSKTEALRDLAKHFGLLTDKLEHSGAVEIAWKRAEE